MAWPLLYTHRASKSKYLRYNDYIKEGFPIATGVIEGACRHLIKDRMDVTGARWSLQGAEAVIKLRSLMSSKDFERYWEFHEMCKEAQAAKDSGKKLSPLDFRFHFFPWHGHKAYRINSENFDLPPTMQGYFSQLEGVLGYPLELSQKTWYIKRAETQGEDMKREFPSTTDEAFESSNEGLYMENFT